MGRRRPSNAWLDDEELDRAAETARRLAATGLDTDLTSPPPRPAALVSTAAAYTIGDPPNGRLIRPNQVEGWDKETWAMYDCTGELHYVASQYGRAVSRARLFVARRNEDGSTEEVTTGEAGRVGRDMLGGEEMAGDILFTSAVQQFISGQSLLTVHDDEGWQAHSDQDFDVNQQALRRGRNGRGGNGRTLYKVDVGTGRREVLPEGTLTIHMWDRHPGRASSVDSSVRPALPYLRELARLDQYVQSILLSRIALSGILQVPAGSEVIVPPQFGQVPADTSGLMHVLAMVGTTNITNPGTAAAALPVLLQLSRPDDKVEHITLDQPLTEAINQFREINLKRLAMSLDMAPEAMSGFSDVKYSNAEWIQDESVQTHIVRRVSSFASALTMGYVVPALNDDRAYFCGYDLSDLESDEDRTDAAVALYDRGEIDGESLRRLANMRDASPPEGAELLKQLAIRAVTSNPSLFPALAPLLGLRDVINLSPDQCRTLTEAGPGDSGLEPQEVTDPAPVEQVTPDVEDPEAVRGPQPFVSDALVAACDVVVSAALCAAGSKWRKRSRSRVGACRGTDPQAVYLVHPIAADRAPHESAREYAAQLVADRWPQLPRIAALHAADATCLQATLSAYVADLITHQRPHDPASLVEVVQSCVA